MAKRPEFTAATIDQVLQTAQRHAQASATKGVANHQTTLSNSSLKMAAECISVTVENGQVCLKLPFNLGDICLPIPSIIPNGTVAQACLDICTVLGIPCGVEVSVSVAGNRIVSQHFGCSC